MWKDPYSVSEENGKVFWNNMTSKSLKHVPFDCATSAEIIDEKHM
jgi:hypothetical protein